MTREEAIRDIEECVIPYVGGISLRMAVEDMKEMDRLSKAVPVLKEPDRPHGEWKPIGEPDDLGIHSWHICSSCGFRTTWHMVDIFHFCPNCGASMQANDRQVTGKLDENTQKHYGFRKKY